MATQIGTRRGIEVTRPAEAPARTTSARKEPSSRPNARQGRGGEVVTPLPRELKQLQDLAARDVVHALMRGGCSERVVARVLPGIGYLLTNGGTIRALTASSYHLPGRCPGLAAPPPAKVAPREFKIPSDTHPGITYTVLRSEEGHLFCNCGAGSYGRPCKHKRKVAALLAAEQGASGRAAASARAESAPGVSSEARGRLVGAGPPVQP